MINLHTHSFINEDSWIQEKIQSEKVSGKKIWLHFGVSANPWHLGHESYVQVMADAIRPNLISLCPAKTSPFKGDILQGTSSVKKEMMEAALAQFHQKYPDTDSCQTIVNTQELDAAEAYSFTWKTIGDVWERAQQDHAETYLLLTTETAQDFYSWTNPLYIVEHATIVYGNRPGVTFDKTKLINKLHAIDRIARAQGVTEEGTHADYLSLAKDGLISGSTVEILIGDGTTETMDIPAEKIRPIHPKIIEALDRGYIPVDGVKDVSSTKIRHKINEHLSIEDDVGPCVAAVITKHGLYSA